MLAWLDRPTRGEVKLELTGWLPLSPGGPRWNCRTCGVASAASQQTTIRLVPGGGVALAEAGRLNLTPANPRPRGGEGRGGVLTYTAGGAGRITAAHGRSTPGRRRFASTPSRTLANGRLSFAAVVDVEPAFGGVEALEVRVRNWAGNVKIKEPKGIHQRALRRGPDEWAWRWSRTPESRAGCAWCWAANRPARRPPGR